MRDERISVALSLTMIAVAIGWVGTCIWGVIKLVTWLSSK
jgi:hypothetical protein